MGGGDEDSMRSRVWATLFHCMSTDDDSHHTRCPQSWCFFYQQALAEDKEPPPHEGNVKYLLAYYVAKAIVPVYKRMSDPNLLKHLVKCKTQNSNESLHSIIWSRCSKTVFVGWAKLHGAVVRAVSCFNAGACQLTQVMELLAIEVNEVSQAYVEVNDRQRILQSDRASIRSAKVDHASTRSAKVDRASTRSAKVDRANTRSAKVDHASTRSAKVDRASTRSAKVARKSHAEKLKQKSARDHSREGPSYVAGSF